MTDYKPTFKVSPKKRPWYKRLTPLAWFFIGLAGVVVILSGIAGWFWLDRRLASADEPWVPDWTPTPTAPPPPTPTPTPTATPGPVPAHPAWWTDQMTQDEEGHWWPPEEVVRMVQEDFQSWYDEMYALVEANDLEGIVENLPRWFTGDSLEWYQAYYAEVEAGERALGLMVWESTLIQVQDWSEDGMECTLGWTALNGTSHRWVDGEFVEATTYPGGLYLWRMRYDPTDGRWKMSEFIKHYPAGGE